VGPSGMDSYGTRQGQLAGSCEQGNELPGFVKYSGIRLLSWAYYVTRKCAPCC